MESAWNNDIDGAVPFPNAWRMPIPDSYSHLDVRMFKYTQDALWEYFWDIRLGTYVPWICQKSIENETNHKSHSVNGSNYIQSFSHPYLNPKIHLNQQLNCGWSWRRALHQPQPSSSGIRPAPQHLFSFFSSPLLILPLTSFSPLFFFSFGFLHS